MHTHTDNARLVPGKERQSTPGVHGKTRKSASATQSKPPSSSASRPMGSRGRAPTAAARTASGEACRTGKRADGPIRTEAAGFPTGLVPPEVGEAGSAGREGDQLMEPPAERCEIWPLLPKGIPP